MLMLKLSSLLFCGKQNTESCSLHSAAVSCRCTFTIIVLNPFTLDESTEFIFNGVSSRAVPPRMYCDICDQFDLHETEDCPIQVTW